jgi:general secretion pathway protein A
MYLEYWGLQKFPFENVPDPEFMYYSTEHEEALARLLYVVKRNKGAMLLTGEIGCGKTLLSRVFIRELAESDYDIGLITNPSLIPMDFVREMLYQFGVNTQATAKTELLTVLNERMMQNVQNNRTMLIIIDEAQLIPMETLEEIRLLLNFQLNDRYLLNLILIGQPELRDKIRGHKQLDQRIFIRYHLNPLNLEDVRNYIAFRLQKAGQPENMFTQEAMDEIFSHSDGLPRKVNNICDLSLLIGFSMKYTTLDVEIVRKVIQDSM